MGDLGDAFSFAEYAAALRRLEAIQPAEYALAEMIVLGGLGLGALTLFVLMLVRRSGTAAAGFALIALLALSMAIVFGTLDFLTDGTTVLIGSLTASALVLFVNAVLHTGRENLFIAGLSAIVIGLTVTLGGLTAMGFDYASQARLGMIGGSVFAALVLAFAMLRAPAGQGVLGIAVLSAIVGGGLMLDQVSPMLSGTWMTVLPVALVSGALLLAAMAAPFVADEVTMRRGASGGYSASAAMEPGPLFQSFDGEDQGDGDMPPFMATEAPDDVRFDPPLSHPPSAPEPYQPEPPLAAPPRQAAAVPEGDPVSSYWSAGTVAAPLEAQADEYIWDALADPEVRCGQDVVAAFGAYGAQELSPEGLRERLQPNGLPTFDDQVLGGGDPVSGPFDIVLETTTGAFRFTGRRQVDHDGILMRLDARLSQAGAGVGAAQNFAPPPAPQSGYQQPSEPMVRSAPPLTAQFKSVARLSDSVSIGFDASPEHPPQSDEDVKALVDEAARSLAEMIAEDPSRGPFVLLDAEALACPFGLVASAVGRAVRTYQLPRGALVVGFTASGGRHPKGFSGAADDVRMAGAGAALILRDLSGKAAKLRPDMVWIDARDAKLADRGKRSVLQGMAKRLNAPIVVRNVRSDAEAQAALREGAIFATGAPFGDRIDAPTAPPHGSAPQPVAHSGYTGFSAGQGRPVAHEPSAQSGGFGDRQTMRSQGLR